jgi:hypothetical protein
LNGPISLPYGSPWNEFTNRPGNGVEAAGLRFKLAIPSFFSVARKQSSALANFVSSAKIVIHECSIVLKGLVSLSLSRR